MRSRQGIRRGVAVLIVSGLQACVAPPKTSAPPPPAPPIAQDERLAEHPAAAPVVVLMEKAQGEQRAGRLDQATATLERALRIDPYHPMLWQRLAAIRLKQGDSVQAEAMAAKSNTLGSHDQDLRAGNWSIIARARRLRGDEAGAREAEERARGHKGLF